MTPAERAVIEAARAWKLAHYEDSEGPALQLAARFLYAAVADQLAACSPDEANEEGT